MDSLINILNNLSMDLINLRLTISEPVFLSVVLQLYRLTCRKKGEQVQRKGKFLR